MGCFPQQRGFRAVRPYECYGERQQECWRDSRQTDPSVQQSSLGSYYHRVGRNYFWCRRSRMSSKLVQKLLKDSRARIGEDSLSLLANAKIIPLSI